MIELILAIAGLLIGFHWVKIKRIGIRKNRATIIGDNNKIIQK